jgi:hypothetical protein
MGGTCEVVVVGMRELILLTPMYQIRYRPKSFSTIVHPRAHHLEDSAFVRLSA